jgi:hypothetical protein
MPLDSVAHVESLAFLREQALQVGVHLVIHKVELKGALLAARNMQLQGLLLLARDLLRPRRGLAAGQVLALMAIQLGGLVVPGVGVMQPCDAEVQKVIDYGRSPADLPRPCNELMLGMTEQT